MDNQMVGLMFVWTILLVQFLLTSSWCRAGADHLVCCYLSAVFTKNSRVHPVLGEKVVCAAISLHLYRYCQSYKRSATHHPGSCILTSEISVMVFVMPWRLPLLKVTDVGLLTLQTFCLSPDVLARTNQMSVMIMPSSLWSGLIIWVKVMIPVKTHVYRQNSYFFKKKKKCLPLFQHHQLLYSCLSFWSLASVLSLPISSLQCWHLPS